MITSKKLADSFWNHILQDKKWKLILFISAGTVVLRINTAFIDYIHVDVLTSYLIALRDLDGLPFVPNKGPVYHSLVKWSVLLLGKSPTSFHITGIVFILLTLVFIYLLARTVYNERTGLVAAMFYGFIISSYNIEFLATNAEVIYNLFFMISFYSFFMVAHRRRFIYTLPLAAGICLAVMTKFQGIFSLFALLAYAVFIYPFFIFKKHGSYRRYLIFISGTAVSLMIICFLDWKFFSIVFSESTRMRISPLFQYVANRGFSPFSFLSKLSWKAFHFALYHGIVWIPGIFQIYRTIRKKSEPGTGDLYLGFITTFMLLTVFLGGSRLSIHYFIPVLPTLSILASRYVVNSLQADMKNSRKYFLMFALPVIFFFSWNMKDLYIKEFNPDLKHNESYFTFYFRQIFISSYGEYLLPYRELLPAISHIQNTADPQATLFVWPMGSEMVYYAQRQSSTTQFWYNEGSLFAIVQREKGDLSFYKQYQEKLSAEIREADPDYFIDTGGTSIIRKVLLYKKKGDPAFCFNPKSMPMFRFGTFATLDDLPIVVDYLNSHFQFEGNFGKVRIWKKVR